MSKKYLVDYSFTRAMLLLGSVPVLWSAGDLHAQQAGQETSQLPTIVVTGQPARSTSYRTQDTMLSPFGAQRLVDTPASISTVSRAQLDAQQSHLLSDVVANDSSVQNDYAPVGYYENFSVRGFPLDLATSYQINGLTVSGEQNIALDNKERVEILKGLAGLEAGIAPPGGLVNFVTKRPADVRSLLLNTDSHGSRGAGIDLGQWFGPEKQFGLRINAAHDDLHSYVNGADGVRNFASLSADWNILPWIKLEVDAEDQHRSQHSVPGYQLLGGTMLPTPRSPGTLLGAQSWARPVTNDSYTIQSRLALTLNPDWKLIFAASRSQVIVDDNSAFPYGCYFAAGCADGSTPGQFFASNGDYDVYDYRFPDDTRRNDMLQATLQGKVRTGFITHQLVFGASLFRRTISQSDGVNEYVGSDNIYNPQPLQLAQDNLTPGPSTPRLDSRQRALTLLDQMTFGPHWSIQAGGRQVWLRESAFDSDGSTNRLTSQTTFLPQLALIYHLQPDLSLYVSYSKGLTMGGQAAFWATNAFAYLPPSVSRQIETGVKYDWNRRLLLGAALFRMARPYEYPQPGVNGLTFVQQGNSVHQGLELSAAGRVTDRLQLSASVTALSARARDTGTPAYDDQQEINVARLRAALYAAYQLPQIEGLSVQGGWQYSGHKAATRDGSVQVPAYHVFNAGLTYDTRIGQQRAIWRLAVDNLFDKRYWKDVGEYIGDAYLFQGAPRVARLSLQIDF